MSESPWSAAKPGARGIVLFLHELDFGEVEFNDNIIGFQLVGHLEILFGLGPLALIGINGGAKGVKAGGFGVLLDGGVQFVHRGIKVLILDKLQDSTPLVP